MAVSVCMARAGSFPFGEWSALRRGGAKTLFYWGDATDSVTISLFEWFRPAWERVHEVGLLKPNPYGLYDAMGNAIESIHPESWECQRDDYRADECWIKEQLRQHEPITQCSYVQKNDRKGHPELPFEFRKECSPSFLAKEYRGFRRVRQIFLE